MKTLMEEYRKKTMAVLTDEQRAALALHGKVSAAVRHFLRAGLTDEQKAKVAEIVKGAGDLPDEVQDKTKRGAVVPAWKKVFDEIERTVLTAEQKETMQKPPARGPGNHRGRDKKAPPAGAAHRRHHVTAPSPAARPPRTEESETSGPRFGREKRA